MEFLSNLLCLGMKSKPTDVAELMSQRLRQVQERTESLRQLQQATTDLLGSDLRGRYRVANLRDGVMIIETDSAAWATRLQFMKLQLLQQLRQQGFPMLTTIEIKVNPTLSRIERQVTQNLNRLSPQAASQIQELAESIGGSLGEKLKKLAAHGGGQQNNS
ncbi:DUF721 domain-containing protein [Ferrimonas sediminicola]|uniref:DUF721 domain-containing protein n=1 Tax=Ferrimonas sediminicola TaxID=2569538 RepID=A0A4U1BKW0_9GAMM|nr:DciA family protein [Ferrimonas sediminicola]TKB51277.1 DUF721 domain-containing protein [Ferrimonas sediminicola]